MKKIFRFFRNLYYRFKILRLKMKINSIDEEIVCGIVKWFDVRDRVFKYYDMISDYKVKLQK